MKQSMRSYIAHLGLILLVLSACGKKVAKTTGESSGEASRVDGGTSVATTSDNWWSSSSSNGGSSADDGDVDNDGINDAVDTSNGLRHCSTVVSSVTEESLAGFFFKTVVPQSERAWDPADLNAKYWDNGKLKGLMDIEGNVTICLVVSGSAASLRVEYEDHFATTWVEIPSSKTYYFMRDASNIDIVWMDSAGFIRLHGPRNNAVIRFANMPSTTALNARSSTDKTAAPLAYYYNQRNQCRTGSATYTVDKCVKDFTYSPDMFLDSSSWPGIALFSAEGGFTASQKQRLRDMIYRYVDADTTSTTTHPFNSNYNRYLIKNGTLGSVNVQ